jgi:leader peptidase (prepilin peptidase)/N-methyltransferase
VDGVSMVFLLFMFIIGLSAGSFITSYTYRVPKGGTTSKGRSYCPKCKNIIRWFDNIPLLSFFFLKGKCRYCSKKISRRYPMIEFVTSFSFVIIALYFYSCMHQLTGNGVCQYVDIFGMYTVPYLLAVSAIFITVFVTDFEHQIILDELVFLLFILTFIMIILYSPATFYSRLLSGFIASLFLLFLHLVTKGRGMGLGDVKLALAGGMILGWPLTLVWVGLSFIIGGVVGVMLLVNKRTKFGNQIAFGPFLVLAFFITLIFGDNVYMMFFT